MRALLISLCLLPAVAHADPLTDLGRALFFDASLSQGGAQSCASCHDPANGFASATPFPQGAVAGHFGSRKPPSLAYGAQAPVLHHVMDEGAPLILGGDFADGRATGQAGGDPAAEQALAPMLNPDEMAALDRATLAARACAAQAALIDAVEAGLCPARDETSEQILTLMGQALAAFEASPEVARFSSRFDAGELSAQDSAGLALFQDKAQCFACHVLTRGPRGERALFTDFSYDNLGVPKNRDNPYYSNPANPLGRDWRDAGLAATLAADPVYAAYAGDNAGKFKVPTLRNLWTGQPRAYMHNGWFKTLEGVVHFYNTRDVLPACADDWASEAEALARNCWPAPEVAEGVNKDELGNLKLSPAEEAALVAFLKTLTDR